MSQEIRMPAFSASMTEGTLLSWTKRVGDRVEPGEIIAEIETDKATAELEAEHGGILAEIVVPAGTENVSVGQVIAVLQSAELRLLRAPAPATAPTPARDATPTPVPAQGRDAAATPVPAGGRDAAATPLARRMAAHAGVDLAALSGSGLGGRIRKADVEAALGGAISAAAVAPTMPRILVAPSAHGAAPPFHELPHTRIRRSIAKRLSAAKREIPHFYLRVECRVDALLACRKRLAAAAPDVKLSLNDFVIRAAALALRETPEANVSWGEDALRIYDRVDVCVAVATDAGLVTPVLRDADAKGLAEIGREMRELATRARAGRLAPHELDGGTFSISNLGMYGVESLNAILNPPQACILGVGAALEKPVVVEGALAVGTVMVCTLSCDHRAIDGAVAARLLAGVQKRLEDPSVMLL